MKDNIVNEAIDAELQVYKTASIKAINAQFEAIRNSEKQIATANERIKAISIAWESQKISELQKVVNPLW